VALCLDLLKQKRLALVPGSSFGAPGTVRISYATSMEELELAMNKLEEFLLEDDF
jgi:aspartate/methionine/tyrosine aminotransferase